MRTVKVNYLKYVKRVFLDQLKYQISVFRLSKINLVKITDVNKNKEDYEIKSIYFIYSYNILLID